MGQSYANPRAFKDALEARIKSRAGEQGIAMNRLRQLVLFERLLARIYEACGDAVIVKGGFVLELRLAGASGASSTSDDAAIVVAVSSGAPCKRHQSPRTTKDIDLRIEGDLDELIDRIVTTARQSSRDYLTFDFTGERDFE